MVPNPFALAPRLLHPKSVNHEYIFGALCQIAPAAAVYIRANTRHMDQMMQTCSLYKMYNGKVFQTLVHLLLCRQPVWQLLCHAQKCPLK